MTNIQILILSSLFIISVLIIIVASRYGYIGKIKNKDVGDGQYGSDRFANNKEIKKTYLNIEYNPQKWRTSTGSNLKPGIIIGGKKSFGKTKALVEPGDVHALMIGASGVGKTAFFLYPNIEYALASGVSFISTDTKGDVYKNIAPIAEKYYGYKVEIIDLRNPNISSGYNFLALVNKYMDIYLEDKTKIWAKAKAETYAKIISKTIINSGISNQNYGANSFFYDSAEGLITSAILLVSEYCEKDERHIVSVIKILQSVNQETTRTKKKSNNVTFKEILSMLPENHKARWFAFSALSASDITISSVLSTALSKLNSFLDSELEYVLCKNETIDAETFENEKCCIFLVLPEEDNTKHFMASLIVVQTYRELLSISDEMGGRLKRKIMFFLDEFGTIPRIQSADMMFSASRSRNISIIAIIQSFAQLDNNYGSDEAKIIIDNTQLTIFGGFAPMSSSSKQLSQALGEHTVQGGSSTFGNDSISVNLQMIKRPLLTEGELKRLGRGEFIIMKTFSNPVRSHFMLYTEWGITFDNKYEMQPSTHIKIKYATLDEIYSKIMEEKNTKIFSFGR